MKKVPIIVAAVFCLCVFVAIGIGQDKPSDKETLIKAARLLEEKPLDKDAKKIREWAMFYVIQTKDVSVVICASDQTRPALDKKNKFGSELLGQYTIGMAAFKLEHPEKKDEENAAQLAGILSMLKAYEQMVKENSKAKFGGIDDILAKRDNGTLEKEIVAANCAKK